MTPKPHISEGMEDGEAKFTSSLEASQSASHELDYADRILESDAPNLPQRLANGSMMLSALIEQFVETNSSTAEMNEAKKKEVYRDVMTRLGLASLPSQISAFAAPQLRDERNKYLFGLSTLLSDSAKAVHQGQDTSVPVVMPDTAVQLLPVLIRGQLGYPSLTNVSPLLQPSTFGLENSRYVREYEDPHFLGKGGFGEVWDCRHKLDNQRYAIKRVLITKAYHAIKDQGEVSETVITEFFKEIRALARVHHPNIVRYHNSWIEVVSCDDYAKIREEGEQHPSAFGEFDTPYVKPVIATRLPVANVDLFQQKRRRKSSMKGHGWIETMNSYEGSENALETSYSDDSSDEDDLSKQTDGGVDLVKEEMKEKQVEESSDEEIAGRVNEGRNQEDVEEVHKPEVEPESTNIEKSSSTGTSSSSLGDSEQPSGSVFESSTAESLHPIAQSGERTLSFDPFQRSNSSFHKEADSHSYRQSDMSKFRHTSTHDSTSASHAVVKRQAISKEDALERILFIQMSMHPLTLSRFLQTGSDDGLPRHTYHPLISVQLLLKIMDGVDHLHKCKMVHRDLKPGNIFLSIENVETGTTGGVQIGGCSCPVDKGEPCISHFGPDMCQGHLSCWIVPKIGDFGLAHDISDPVEVAAGQAATGSSVSGVRRKRKIIGTAHYRPPIDEDEDEDEDDMDVHHVSQRSNQRDPCEKTDVYALGVILFELLYKMDTGAERGFVLPKVTTRSPKAKPADFLPAHFPTGNCWPHKDDLVKIVVDMTHPKRSRRIDMPTARISLESWLSAMNDELQAITGAKSTMQLFPELMDLTSQDNE